MYQSVARPIVRRESSNNNVTNMTFLDKLQNAVLQIRDQSRYVNKCICEDLTIYTVMQGRRSIPIFPGMTIINYFHCSIKDFSSSHSYRLSVVMMDNCIGK